MKKKSLLCSLSAAEWVYFFPVAESLNQTRFVLEDLTQLLRWKLRNRSFTKMNDISTVSSNKNKLVPTTSRWAAVVQAH